MSLPRLKIDETVRWRAPLASLAWIQRDGEYVVYNAASGRTHHLDAAAGLVFAAAAGSAVSQGSVCRMLSERWGVGVADIDAAAVAATLFRLGEAGLLEGAS